jgi:hypothetical protein
MEEGMIEVRVAVNMAGAHEGQHRWVDPDDPQIAQRLALGYLVRVAPAQPVEAEGAEAEE